MGVEPTWLSPEVFKTSVYAFPPCPRLVGWGDAEIGSRDDAKRGRPGESTCLPLSPSPCPKMEATSGFEPLDRGFADPRLNLLATSPNKWSGRRDSNPRPSPWQGDALPLRHFRSLPGAEGQDRTDDTAIFSRVLYRLSYLGDTYILPDLRLLVKGLLPLLSFYRQIGYNRPSTTN